MFWNYNDVRSISEQERDCPYAVSLFLFGGGMYTCWDVPRMLDKRGIPQTMMSRLCGMLRSESFSGRSGAMLRFFPGKEFDFPNEKQRYWTGRSYSVVNCQMVKWYLKIFGQVLYFFIIYIYDQYCTLHWNLLNPPPPSILVQNSRVCLGLGHRQSVHTATKERVRDALKGGACDFFQIWLYP